MTLNVSQLNQIGGLLQEVNPDGSTNNAATQQLLAQVLEQLGGNFTQTTVSDDLHTHFVAAGGFGITQLAAMVAAIAASIITAGAAAAVMGVALSAMSLPAAMAVGALSAMAGSVVGQLVSGQGLNFGEILKSGAVGALTAGAFSALGAGTQGLQQFGSKLANNIGSITLSDVGKVLGTIAERGVVTAGVDTVVEGGSFGSALENSVLSDVGAIGASAIGAASINKDSLLAEDTPGYVLAHAGLGCALSAAEGDGCAGGAIGGATSALIAPLVRDGLYDGTQTVTTTDNGDGTLTQTTSYNNSAFNAITAGIATLSGGLAAGLAGANVQAGATSAENEVLNNTLSDKERQQVQGELKKEMSHLDSELPGHGKVIIGTDADGEPEYGYKVSAQ
jgi:filamentous hemagglutinin